LLLWVNQNSLNKYNVLNKNKYEKQFGNLVTMAWWNDLWLNEGFASWVEYLGYNYTHPEWKQLDYFFIDTIPVLVKDSYQTSHPISVSVNDPKQIGSLFDSISYDKGSSIIRMMNAFLTENTFKKGVSVCLFLFFYLLSNSNLDFFLINIYQGLFEQ